MVEQVKPEIDQVQPRINPVLAQVLEPLSRYYNDVSTVELRVNRPHVVTLERRGEGKTYVDDPEVTIKAIEQICRTISNNRDLAFSASDCPMISTTLPQGHRLECLMGGSVRHGVSLAIRCKHQWQTQWSDFGLDPSATAYLTGKVAQSANIIVSGGTNTGKTTLLNHLLYLLPSTRRVVAVEDTPELSIDQFSDGVGLLAARGGGGSGMVDWRALSDHVLRITPDHIVFGEISTANAFAMLMALNSGSRGVMCTLHAHSPEQAIYRKFDQNMAWEGRRMERVGDYLAEMIDVVIQIKRSDDGYRRVTDIMEPHTKSYPMRDGVFRGSTEEV